MCDVWHHSGCNCILTLADAKVLAFLANYTDRQNDHLQFTHRGYPDLSSVGHELLLVVAGEVWAADGTSVSAPSVAGMFALVNAELVSHGKVPLGFVNPMLYGAPANVFFDITKGSNFCSGQVLGRAGRLSVLVDWT